MEVVRYSGEPLLVVVTVVEVVGVYSAQQPQVLEAEVVVAPPFHGLELEVEGAFLSLWETPW